MIGPGTGVAPFRGFVQERAAIGASGRNWLFFGNRNFRGEFLYQLEWQRELKSGQLHRLDLVFSRDPASATHAGSTTTAAAASTFRTYVQQPLRARGSDLRSEEHKSELQSLMRISNAVLRFTKKQ